MTELQDSKRNFYFDPRITDDELRKIVYQCGAVVAMRAMTHRLRGHYENGLFSEKASELITNDLVEITAQIGELSPKEIHEALEFTPQQTK